MTYKDEHCWNCGKENLDRYIEINNREWQEYDLNYGEMTGEYVINGCNFLCIDCFTTMIQNRLSVL